MILRDPVHGLVSFDTDEAQVVVELLEAREVQRLRRVSQLGLASLAYPGASHTRFAHALGSAFVMTKLLARLRQGQGELPFWQRVTSERAREALAASLLHDLGHGPFSHLFEEALPRTPRHESWTQRIILDPSTDVHRILSGMDPGLPKRVADLVVGKHELTFLARSVSGVFDVDRCDYLLRDAHFTGVTYGSFDLDWLLRSLRLGVSTDATSAPSLAIDGAKGLPAIESFILARLFMFQQVYFHKTCRASEWMLARILGRVRELCLDGTRLPSLPPALASLAAEGTAELDSYLDLDDAVLWVSLTAWQRVPDPTLSDLTRRLCERRLFKTYDLYGEAADPGARAQALHRARDVAVQAGLDPDVYVGLDAATVVPIEDPDRTLSVRFPDGSSKRPMEVSFVLSRLYGERLERVRLIFAPELRERIVAAVTA
jgi:HD superfamily phosphohydrolase